MADKPEMKPKSRNDAKLALPTSQSRPVARFNVQDLLQGQQEVILEQEGQAYRLRLTASGKLILTK